jgi:hypothetical protein
VWGRNRIGREVVRVIESSVEVWAHEFPNEVAGMQTHKDSLFAVLPELQLKFQNSRVTVTNWDRVRWFEGPTTESNRKYTPASNGKKLSAASSQPTALPAESLPAES